MQRDIRHIDRMSMCPAVQVVAPDAPLDIHMRADANLPALQQPHCNPE